jgi:ketosteroid isomerase-like protein
MSRENVEIVRRVFEAVDRGSNEAVFAWVEETHAADVELRSVGGLPDVGRMRGREAVKHWIAEILGTFEFRTEPEEFIDAGEAVVTVVRQVARGKASGAETVNRLVYVHGFEEGKVVYFDTYRSKAEALEAVGLSE